VKVGKAGSGGKPNLTREVPWHTESRPIFLVFAALKFHVTHIETGQKEEYRE
jgi:hypothetical protein